MLIGSSFDEGWVFADEIREIGVIMGAELQKELWESLDHLIETLPEGDREEFRELMFVMSSNAMNDRANEVRDLVRRWLPVNDPSKSYRVMR
jgi:hypothetical protein